MSTRITIGNIFPSIERRSSEENNWMRGGKYVIFKDKSIGSMTDFDQDA